MRKPTAKNLFIFGDQAPKVWRTTCCRGDDRHHQRQARARLAAADRAGHDRGGRGEPHRRREAVAAGRADWLSDKQASAPLRRQFPPPFPDRFDALYSCANSSTNGIGTGSNRSGGLPTTAVPAQVREVADCFEAIGDAIARANPFARIRLPLQLAGAAGNPEFSASLIRGRFTFRGDVPVAGTMSGAPMQTQSAELGRGAAIRANAFSQARAAMRRQSLNSRNAIDACAGFGDRLNCAQRPTPPASQNAIDTLTGPPAAWHADAAIAQGRVSEDPWSDTRSRRSARDEEFVKADMENPAEVRTAVAGVRASCTRGVSGRGVETILPSAHIRRVYNSSSRLTGRREAGRLGHDHAIGFYPRTRRIGEDHRVRPIPLWREKGLREAVGAMSAYSMTWRHLPGDRNSPTPRSSVGCRLDFTSRPVAAHPHRTELPHPLRDLVGMSETRAAGGTTRSAAHGYGRRPRREFPRRAMASGQASARPGADWFMAAIMQQWNDGDRSGEI